MHSHRPPVVLLLLGLGISSQICFVWQKSLNTICQPLPNHVTCLCTLNKNQTPHCVSWPIFNHVGYWGSWFNKHNKMFIWLLWTKGCQSTLLMFAKLFLFCNLFFFVFKVKNHHGLWQGLFYHNKGKTSDKDFDFFHAVRRYYSFGTVSVWHLQAWQEIIDHKLIGFQPKTLWLYCCWLKMKGFPVAAGQLW